MEAMWTTPKQVEEAWAIAEGFRKELLLNDRNSIPQADGADTDTWEGEGGSGYIARELSSLNGEGK